MVNAMQRWCMTIEIDGRKRPTKRWKDDQRMNHIKDDMKSFVMSQYDALVRNARRRIIVRATGWPSLTRKVVFFVSSIAYRRILSETGWTIACLKICALAFALYVSRVVQSCSSERSSWVFKMQENRLAAAALPRTPLWELIQRSPSSRAPQEPTPDLVPSNGNRTSNRASILAFPNPFTNIHLWSTTRKIGSIYSSLLYDIPQRGPCRSYLCASTKYACEYKTRFIGSIVQHYGIFMMSVFATY